ncbi:MAG: DUF4352 domain-containing protein [Candidatus Methanoperedens sp.]
MGTFIKHYFYQKLIVVDVKLKLIGIILMVLVSVMALGCVESQPSAPTSIENPKSTMVSTPVPTQAQSQKNIIISYYSLKKEDTIQGTVTLYIKMNIENHGYKEFSLDPSYFNLIADKKYNIVATSLRSEKLLDGGTLNGLIIAFEVPSNIVSYQIQYSGFGDYEIIYKATTPTVSPSPITTSNLVLEVKELKERLNKTEEMQRQQETRIRWLESPVNSLLDWLKSL